MWIIKDSTSGGYTSTGDLSRGAFIAAIENGFLDTAWKKLFGLGLGNCESGTPFSCATALSAEPCELAVKITVAPSFKNFSTVA